MAEPELQKAIDFATALVLAAIIALIATIALGVKLASGAEPRRQYDLTDIRVIDGDTLEVTAILGLDVSRRITVRLDNIDAYELRDKPRGPRAKEYAVKWIAEAKGEILTTDGKRDKYGRVIGRIYDEKARCLNDSLLDFGHAVPYPKP